MRGRHEAVRGKHEAPSSTAGRNSTAPSVKEASEQTKEPTNPLGEASSGKKQNFMHGAAILTVGVVIMKLLGAIYKVPLGNILGDYGYGIFLATYNVYNIFFTLSTAGLPVALSRLIAEADARGQESLKEKTFRAAIVTFAAIGMVFSLIMFFGNQWLATAYLVKPDAALSVRAMAPAILLVCLVSAYRGYCQGNGNMIPTTVDEVLEVLFKVISGLAISAMLVHAGRGLPEASAGAILGVSIGSVISLGYMIVYKHRNYRRMSVGEEVKDSGLKIAGTILKIGIPAMLQSMTYSVTNVILQVVVNGFGTAYVAGWAACAKGDQLFWMLTQSFGIAVTTFVGQNYGAGHYQRVRKCIRQGFLIETILTLTCVAFLWTATGLILSLFTTDKEVFDLAFGMMHFFIPCYVTWICNEIISSTLRGLGDSIFPMIISISGVCVFRIVWVLTAVRIWPQFRTIMLSYPISWVLTSILLVLYFSLVWMRSGRLKGIERPAGQKAPVW